MSKFVGLVYDPPAVGMPFLAVMFDELDMSKVMVAIPVQSLAAGEAAIERLAEGLVRLASRDRDA